MIAVSVTFNLSSEFYFVGSVLRRNQNRMFSLLVSTQHNSALSENISLAKALLVG